MDNKIKNKLEIFFSQYKNVHYRKGEVLLRAGDPVFGIFLLKKGLVRQSIISEDGDELIIHIFRPISFFPMMLAISELSNKYNFEAIEEVEVWRAPPEKVMDFLKNEPEVLLDLTKRFSLGLVGLSSRLEQLLFRQSHHRIASILLYFAKHFGQITAGKTTIELPMTHKDLASWTGLTRETTSRQVEKMIKNKLIEQKGHRITINNLSQLKAIAKTD